MPAHESDLETKIAGLPDAPGVYLLKDRRGVVLYVGKAKSLRSRVRSYFAAGAGDGRRLLPFLIARVVDLDTLVTDNEKEAFLLENNLIKRHKPRYNVRLVDDKTYLSLRLDRTHPFPRFTTVRQRRADGSRYFGPYSSARSARSTLKLIYRNFGIRSCSDSVFDSRTRPCLYYQIGQCLAPCVDYVSEADYADALGQAELFISGRTGELRARLESEMTRLADDEQFERAAKVRDRLRAVDRTLERQHVALDSDADFDVIGHVSSTTEQLFVWLYVRDGRVIDTTKVRVHDPGHVERSALLSSVLAQAYEKRPVPALILVPVPPHDSDLLEQVLSERRGARVAIQVPQRGDRKRLLELAQSNAEAAVVATAAAAGGSRHAGVLESLRVLLSMPRSPQRIECFDISNLGGTLAVGSMVVMLDGKPNPAGYRRYRVRLPANGDDYASMREVLARRLTRAIDDGQVADLYVVDGGRGQVAIARSVLEELGIEEATLIGLAKGPRRNAGREAIHLDDGSDPIYLPHADPRLHLLQRIRDEAHRFAITYNRKLRAKRDLHTALLDVPGVGPSRARTLLKEFGSVAAVARANPREIVARAGLPQAVAERIHATFGSTAAADDASEPPPPP